MKTWKNKAIALVLIGIGILSALISGDGTFLAFALIIGIPLFFSKKSYVPSDYADYILDEDGNLHKIQK